MLYLLGLEMDEQKSFKILLPLVVEIGYREEIALPEKVIKKWLSTQKSQSEKEEKKNVGNT